MNGIAIWTLPHPILFIFNTTSHQYSLVELLDENNKVIDLDIEKLINDIKQNKLEVNKFFHFFLFFIQKIYLLKTSLWVAKVSLEQLEGLYGNYIGQ